MSNKVWFITGSSRGLGLELAKAVLAAGQRLVATARNPQSLSGLVEQYGDRVRVVQLDVTSSQSARAAVAAALAAFGRLDVVVNNAGYAKPMTPRRRPSRQAVMRVTVRWGERTSPATLDALALAPLERSW